MYQILKTHSNGQFLVTANRGSVAAYVIDASTGALSYAPGSPFNTSSLQVAPFMLALDATGTFLYVSDTGNNGIPGFTVDGTTGALTLINGSPFPGSSASDLVPNPAGPQFFTASNLVIANVQ